MNKWLQPELDEVYARDVRLGDTVRDTFYGITIKVVAIRGGVTITLYGADDRIANIAPDTILRTDYA